MRLLESEGHRKRLGGAKADLLTLSERKDGELSRRRLSMIFQGRGTALNPSLHSRTTAEHEPCERIHGAYQRRTPETAIEHSLCRDKKKKKTKSNDPEPMSAFYLTSYQEHAAGVSWAIAFGSSL